MIDSESVWKVIGGPAVGALLGFLLGLVAFALSEGLKAGRERRALASLFVDHFDEVWKEVDLLKSAPTEPYLARIKTTVLGVSGLSFTGTPEFMFEVDDLKLFQTHGVKLATLLDSKTRARFWNCYRLLRKAEAVRALLERLPQDAPDRMEFQKAYVQLVTKYGESIVELDKLLWRESSFWRFVLPRST